MNTAAAIKEAGRGLGFELVGIAPAATPAGISRLYEWIERGFAGEMDYIPRRRAAYEQPDQVLKSVRSLIVAAMNYRSAEPQPVGPNEGRIARYAWGTADYHEILRDRLKRLADRLHELVPECRTRTAVDTAPLLERDFARLAGLGWFGKNTMLINKRQGSYFFLGCVLTDAALEYDQPHETTHCGTCTRCLEVCPTQAFPEPYVLDARRCISYLTIELKTPIPAELRPGIGDWLFGCDLCQEVCPWNRKAPATSADEFHPQHALNPASALEMLNISRSEFERRFGRTPLARPGWIGLRRNAAIVLGNTGDERAIPALREALDDPEPIIREAAAWALRRMTERGASVP
jgi:epoxyqueuosine reductase